MRDISVQLEYGEWTSTELYIWLCTLPTPLPCTTIVVCSHVVSLVLIIFNVLKKQDSNLPLHLAAANGHLEVVRLMKEREVDFNAQNTVRFVNKAHT